MNTVDKEVESMIRLGHSYLKNIVKKNKTIKLVATARYNPNKKVWDRKEQRADSDSDILNQ